MYTVRKLLRGYFDGRHTFKWPLPLWREKRCREVRIRVDVWTVHFDREKWPMKRDGR